MVTGSHAGHCNPRVLRAFRRAGIDAADHREDALQTGLVAKVISGGTCASGYERGDCHGGAGRKLGFVPDGGAAHGKDIIARNGNGGLGGHRSIVLLAHTWSLQFFGGVLLGCL